MATFLPRDEKRRAAFFSLLAALLLTTVKLVLGIATNSLGILSEALHSGLDLLASGLTLLAVHVAAKPADARHGYGHGKAENLSALAQTMLLFITCTWVGWEGVHRLLLGDAPIRPSLWGVGVMLFSMGIDINRVRVLRRVARRCGSQALEADALHFSTDILSSAVVLLGVLAACLADIFHASGATARILHQADTVAALLVVVIIFFTSLRMAFASLNALMDAGTPSVNALVSRAALAVPGVLAVHGVRARQSGAQHFIELRLGVAPSQDVADAHVLAHAVEQAVCGVLPGADVTVHLEPHESDGTMPSPFSAVRTEAARLGLHVHHVSIYGENSPAHIELHAEMPGGMDYARAHSLASGLEAALRARFPGADAVTHIEPMGPGEGAAGSTAVPASLEGSIKSEVRALVRQEPLLEEPHSFTILEAPDGGISLAFHCVVAPGLNVEQAHALCSRLEGAIRHAFPLLSSVMAHLEPGRQAS
ncbi:MAG: cation diffusion facilitator family transporter [Mailhella sp.]|nr:cation diffusion facilitator family transporter [Mailhella sp.]